MNAGRRFHDRGALKQWELHFGPNMTPMVDIVMVILIFFMARSALIGPEWFLRAALPRQTGAGTSGAAAAAPDPFELPPARFEIDLRVDASGRTLVTGLGLAGAAPDDLAGPLGELAGVRDEAVVLIRPAAAVPYRDVVLVRDLCERAGIGSVGLLPPPDAPPADGGSGPG